MSTWPEDLYLTNNLKDRHNITSSNRLMDQDESRILHTFYAIDLKRDCKTGAMQVNFDPTMPITQTGGLPSCLKVCAGATVILTYNMDQYDKLINGSIVTVINIQSRSKEWPCVWNHICEI